MNEELALQLVVSLIGPFLALYGFWTKVKAKTEEETERQARQEHNIEKIQEKQDELLEETREQRAEIRADLRETKKVTYATREMAHRHELLIAQLQDKIKDVT